MYIFFKFKKQYVADKILTSEKASLQGIFFESLLNKSQSYVMKSTQMWIACTILFLWERNTVKKQWKDHI